MSDEKKQDVTDEQLKDVSGGRTVEIDDSDVDDNDSAPEGDSRPVGRPGSW